jgi:bifunctional non-homologous end joining protein LigD
MGGGYPRRMGEGGAVGERLAAYRAKRDFAVTPEPAGREVAGGFGRFVVQRHRARRLHYDLRLELDGALVSWAVPKGPTLDPKARQLAVHVEDHPLEYIGFEGVIPRGEYGGGDVIVWDTGSWRPARTEDPADALKRGELHFDLHGEKLAGRFVLVRRGGTDWLLIHKNDDVARTGWNAEDHPRSVISGRTNEEIAAAPAALWQSGVPAAAAAVGLGREPTPAWQATDQELATLDALDGEGRWSAQGRELRLTNLDKPLFPGRDGEPPVTKRELVRYHAVIAPHMLPYLVGRPVNMHRYPDGADRAGFWQKEVPDHAPTWLPRWHNGEADPGETECYAVPDGVAALVWLANFGALELHPWTSALPNVHQSTWALIDIYRARAAASPTSSCSPGCTARRWSISTLPRCPRSPANAGCRSGCRCAPRRDVRLRPGHVGSGRRLRGRTARRAAAMSPRSRRGRSPPPTCWRPGCAGTATSWCRCAGPVLVGCGGASRSAGSSRHRRGGRA